MCENKLQIGSIVHVVMSDGQHRPAICVRIWSNEGGNFQAFLDGMNDRQEGIGVQEQQKGMLWMTSVCYNPDANSTRTWHWPE